jgi:hypothetical protein
VSIPRALSSKTSSEHVAMILSAERPTAGSSQRRCGGLVSSLPWCLRLTVPSAWKVWMTGTRYSAPSSPGWGSASRAARRAASRAASPDIQKCPCTTSGSSRPQSRAMPFARSPMNGSSSSLGMWQAGPASTWTTSSPGAAFTLAGRSSASRRVYTVTLCPRRARASESAATWTFCPPASTPPSAASGLACSETMEIFMGCSFLAPE